MSGSPLADRFGAFFRAVNDGCDPYPWQLRLVERIATSGRWPSAIAAPTGAGKSSVVDVHVFVVAAHAAGWISARPPRRLVLVAPRRVLVDDQHERARVLSERLEGALDGASSATVAGAPSLEGPGPTAATADDDTVRVVASALRRLAVPERAPDRMAQCEPESASPSAHAAPLLVTRLRGGVVVDDRWRLDPACCQIVCATPQMWGSRLLLRGYRASMRSRNLETGLLAHDVVVVIDEAHLHERLVGTAQRVVALDPGTALTPQIVAMSATRAAEGAVGLTEDDLEHPALRARVRARKTIVRSPVQQWQRDAVPVAVEAARAMTGSGTVGLFVNTVAQALAAARLLQAAGLEVETVCGRMRPADLEGLRRRRPGLLDARGNADVAVLVTTQSLEVGVDLDLRAMVSLLAPGAALAQRLGRLNRSGGRDDSVFHVVIPAEVDQVDARQVRPYVVEDLVAAAGWLERLDGDASPERIATVPPPAPTSRSALPALRRTDLQTLAITSETLAADVDVGFYIDEPREREDASVGVGARRHADRLSATAVRTALRAAPPRDHELASLGLDRSRGAFVPGAPLRDVLQAALRAFDPSQGRCDAEEEPAPVWVVRRERDQVEAFPVRRLETLTDPTRADAPGELPGGLRPGDAIVVGAGAPICTGHVVGVGRVGSGERRGAGDPIDDVSADRSDGVGADLAVVLGEEQVAGVLAEHGSLLTRSGRDAMARMLEATGGTDEGEAARRLRRRLADHDVVWCPPGPAAEDASDTGAGRGLLVLVDRQRSGAAPAAAAGAGAVLIADHQRDVAERAADLVRRLGAPSIGVKEETVVRAAGLHDEGKRHPRFQRRMGVGADRDDGTLVGPVAKPLAGHRPDRGDGWRHEQLSVAVAAAATGGDPLVGALVGAHHGVRPVFDRDADELLRDWPDVPADVRREAVRLFGPAGSYERERERVERRLGVHRLAFLEALVRCADVQVSKEGR